MLVQEELVFTSERDELLEMMAVQMLKPAAAAAEPTQPETIEMRVREMEFREKELKLQLEMQREQQAAQQEIQRQQLEAERQQRSDSNMKLS